MHRAVRLDDEEVAPLLDVRGDGIGQTTRVAFLGDNDRPQGQRGPPSAAMPASCNPGNRGVRGRNHVLETALRVREVAERICEHGRLRSAYIPDGAGQTTRATLGRTPRSSRRAAADRASTFAPSRAMFRIPRRRVLSSRVPDLDPSMLANSRIHGLCELRSPQDPVPVIGELGKRAERPHHDAGCRFGRAR